MQLHARWDSYKLKASAAPDLAQRARTTRTHDGDQAGPLCALLGVASAEQREVGGRREWAWPGPRRLPLGAGLSGPAAGVNVGPGRFRCGHLRSCRGGSDLRQEVGGSGHEDVAAAVWNAAGRWWMCGGGTGLVTRAPDAQLVCELRVRVETNPTDQI